MLSAMAGLTQAAVTEALRGKYAVLGPLLDERTRRLWAAAEARAIGRGGVTRVAEATGMSRVTVRAGLRELDAGAAPVGAARQRRPGGGRKTLTARDAGLVDALERELEPVTRGDPTGPLRWTCSSAARLARRLRDAGHPVSERTVNRLLHELGYSLQANRKTLEGRQHPTATRSSGASTDACGRSSAWGSRWCRWTRRRRSWSARTATAAGNGVRRDAPRR